MDRGVHRKKRLSIFKESGSSILDRAFIRLYPQMKI
jgi:hypothetical protein